MASAEGNRKFTDELMEEWPLDIAIEWITANLEPNEVFGDAALKRWTMRNDFTGGHPMKDEITEMIDLVRFETDEGDIEWLCNYDKAVLLLCTEVERLEAERLSLLKWAKERRAAEVDNRSDKNIHKRNLCITWDQVIRKIAQLDVTRHKQKCVPQDTPDD